MIDEGNLMKLVFEDSLYGVESLSQARQDRA